ncbi:uncharacterized protein TNCV_300681 [Trichonephila clavipes]|nr:uncharacterized protein TNCV_300681 [Trichonephila clavipes]
MWAYPTENIRGTWNHPKCHLQALETIPMMVMGVDVTAQVAPELQRRIRTGIWQLLPKEIDGARHQTCSSDLFSRWYDIFKANRVQTLRTDWSINS